MILFFRGTCRVLCTATFAYIFLLLVIASRANSSGRRSTSGPRSFAIEASPGVYWPSVSAPMQPSGRRSKASVERLCLEEFNCVVDDFVDDAGRKVRYRCLHPGCNARLRFERDCRRHALHHQPAPSVQRHAWLTTSTGGGRSADGSPPGGPPLPVWNLQHTIVCRAASRAPVVGFTINAVQALVAPAQVSPPSPLYALATPGRGDVDPGGRRTPATVPVCEFRRVGPNDGGSPHTSHEHATPHTGSGPAPMDWESAGPVAIDRELMALAAGVVAPAEALPGDTSSEEDAGVLSESDESTLELVQSDSDSDAPILDAPPPLGWCDGGCWQRRKPAEGEPVKGTGAWYRYHRQCPILPDHKTTVMQACFSMCLLKDQHRVPDVVVDKLCGYIHHVLLAPDNKFPASYHLLKAVADVPAGNSTASDLCDCCWRVYPPVTGEEPPPPPNDKCGACGAPRYKDTANGSRVPRRQLYNFGAQQTVVDLISKPGMLEAILDSRRDAWTQQHSFWGSPAGQQLDKACGGIFQLQVPVGEIPDVVAIAFTLGAPFTTLRCSSPNRTACIRTSLYARR